MRKAAGDRTEEIPRMCEGEREPRRYKLKFQEFLWPCISISVGLGFLANILCTPALGRRGGANPKEYILNLALQNYTRTHTQKRQ